MIVIDNELLKDCQEGKRRACNQLYEKLFIYLMNICIRYNNNYDEAGAALNAIFLKIVTNLKQRDTNKQFIPWAKAIAMNHLADEFRKAKVLKNNLSFNEDLAPFENKVVDCKLECKLEAQDLIKMIQRLPPACNRIFNLYAIDGYNHREIGEMLGINEGTSKSQLHLARVKLQKMIEDEQKKTKLIRFERTG